MRILETLVYTLALSVSLNSHQSLAQEASPPSLEIASLAMKLNLGENPTWLKLLHYERSISVGKYKSAIHAHSFFLSTSGHNSPKEELIATIRGFQKRSPSEDLNQHAQCRFPARFTWIKNQLNLPDKFFPAVRCPHYEKWSLHGRISSISVLFATGYLGNPASYFGHTLLKFNTGAEIHRSDLLDTSVNYGAIVPENENPISYIVKGLFGGYDGGFSHIEYFYHTHNYGEQELRDMWEYELNLTKRQVEFVVAHAWEVLGKEYTYYFVRKNCAYRLGELIDILDGVTIIPSNRPWTIPQELIRSISEANNGVLPLLKEIRHLPSKQSRFYQKYSQLSYIQKQGIAHIIRFPEQLKTETLSNFDVSEQKEILGVLIDYYQFQLVLLAEEENQKLEQSYNAILRKRLELPAGKTLVNLSNTQYPHKGRRTSLTQLGATHSETLGNFYTFSFRPAYYDSLDSDYGHTLNSTLSMLDIQLGLGKNHLFVREFYLINIFSASSNATGLPGDKGRPWKLKTGLMPYRADCASCLLGFVESGIGATRQLTKSTHLHFLAGGLVHDNKNETGNIAATAQVSINYSHPPLTVLVDIQHREYIQESSMKATIASTEARLRLKKNWDLRIKYSLDHTEEYSIKLGYYW